MATITRQQFASLVDRTTPLLEVGPYASPTFSKTFHNVFYADVLTPEEIRKTCRNESYNHGYNPNNTPDVIDFMIDVNASPSITTNKLFNTVYSSHNIEHQVDLIKHLNEMADLTVDDGLFYMVIPDKRFCFDHFHADSTIGDLIGAHINSRNRHSPANIIDMFVYEAHNNPLDHWNNIHGVNPWTEMPDEELIARVRKSLNQIETNKEKYVDVHAWRFTPLSFLRNITFLNKLNYHPWEIKHIWDTAPGTTEFFVVLSKTDKGGSQ